MSLQKFNNLSDGIILVQKFLSISIFVDVLVAVVEFLNSFFPHKNLLHKSVFWSFSLVFIQTQDSHFCLCFFICWCHHPLCNHRSVIRIIRLSDIFGGFQILQNKQTALRFLQVCKRSPSCMNASNLI